SSDVCSSDLPSDEAILNGKCPFLGRHFRISQWRLNMKKNPLLKLALGTFVLIEIALAGSSYAVVPVSWTDTSGDNTWENALNWTPALEPTNNTFDVE